MFPIHSKVSLNNRYGAPWLEQGECVSNCQDPERDNHTKSVQPSTCTRTSATIKAQRLLVIGNFSLRGTEAPICHPDNLSREVYLPEAPHSQYHKDSTEPGKARGLTPIPGLSFRVKGGCNKEILKY